MNKPFDHPHFKPYEPPIKKKSFYTLYTILFIAIIITMVVSVFAGRQLAREQEAEKTTQIVVSSPAQEQDTEQDAAAFSLPFFKEVEGFENAVIAAAKTAMPAVVSIHVSGTVFYNFKDPFMRMLYGRRARQKPISSMGSGVIIDPKGIIITNDHVINIAKDNRDLRKTRMDIEVVLSDGRKYKARVIRNFPSQDIAILKVEAEELPHIKIGSSSAMQPGQTVLAIGNPFGDALTGGLLGGAPTVTRGIISATRRNLTIPGDSVTRYYHNMLQTDASINEGNSGGALIDLSGQLVGINTAIFSPNQSGSVGIGFAYPADRVKLILKHVSELGDIGNWYTGISIKPINDTIAASLNYEGSGGILVTKIEKDSPGEISGIQLGDVIVKINGFTMTTTEETKSMFEGAIPGETFDIDIFRNGETSSIKLLLGMIPSKNGQ